MICYAGSPRLSTIDLTREERQIAMSLWPFQAEGVGIQKLKELNQFQKDAINLSSCNNFTLIQGPPGENDLYTL